MSNTRLAIVTGATGAIGSAIANGIAADPTFEVLILVRDRKKGQLAVEQIRRVTGNDLVSFAVVDLSLQASIAAFANQFARKVHVLVNDAAIAPRSRQVTAEGHELMFATNVLGYFWLTTRLKQNLMSAAPARVVNVASYWAGDLDLDDLEFKRRRYDNNVAYRQSKQANRMLTVALAEQFNAEQVTVNACHPGDVNSTLSNSLGFGGSESAEAGARTPVWLATSAEVAAMTGKYFADCSEVSCGFASDHTKVERLLALCSQ